MGSAGDPGVDGSSFRSGLVGGGGGRYPIVARSESVGGDSGRITPKVKSGVVVGGEFDGPAFEGPVSDGPGPAFGCCPCWDSWAWPTPFGGSPILVQYFVSDTSVSFELSGTSFGGSTLGSGSPKLVLDQSFVPYLAACFGLSDRRCSRSAGLWTRMGFLEAAGSSLFNSLCFADVVDSGAELGGSINGPELVVDGAGFGSGACATLVDPCSGSGGAELDDACAPADTSGFSPLLRSSSVTFANSSPTRFPNVVVTSLGMCTTSTPA